MATEKHTLSRRQTLARNALAGAGASAFPALPPIRRGRVRRAHGIATGAGELSLALLVRDGAPIPRNVERIRPQAPPEPIEQSPELLFLLLLYAELTEARKRGLRSAVALMAECEGSPHARALSALLNGRA